SPVACTELRGDLLAQLGHADHRRVLVVPRGHVIRNEILELPRRVEIGKALRQINRSELPRAIRHHREDGGADVGELGAHGAHWAGAAAPAAAARMSSCRRRSCLAIKTPATTTMTVTKPTMIVASALISGVMPRRTVEKIIIGSVFVEGPAVKLAMTWSSSERVNASSQPENIAGTMMRSVNTKNNFSGRMPKSGTA